MAACPTSENEPAHCPKPPALLKSLRLPSDSEFRLDSRCSMPVQPGTLGFPDSGVTDPTFGSLVPRQSSADAVSLSTWARDYLWQGHTIQLAWSTHLILKTAIARG